MEIKKDRIAAQHLLRHRRNHKPLTHLPAGCGADDISAGYRIQAELHQLLSESSASPVAGYKIGCTTPVMQSYLGIDQPCAGGITANTIIPWRDTGAAPALGCQDYRALGVECEIAVRLGTALAPGGRPFSAQQVFEAVAEWMMAFELVDNRYEDFSQFGIANLIADDFFNAGAILGAPNSRPEFNKFASVEGEMWINGQSRGHGQGADVLQHPMNALAWIANTYPPDCGELFAGSVILLGSLVQTQWLSPGDHVHAAVSGLGRLEFSVH